MEDVRSFDCVLFLGLNVKSSQVKISALYRKCDGRRPPMDTPSQQYVTTNTTKEAMDKACRLIAVAVLNLRLLDHHHWMRDLTDSELKTSTPRILERGEGKV